MRRLDGQEQPYIPAGPFKLRLPVVHYRLEKSELLQGIIIGSTALMSIPILTEYLGIPYDLAWSVAIIDCFLYILHATLGDPVVPGYITPALPLTLVYITQYEIGEERIQAMIALQLIVAFIFLFMGITKLAGKIVGKVPDSIKGGILLSAPISAIKSEFVEGGRFDLYPIAITVGVGVMAFFSFSCIFKRNREKWKVLNWMAEYGNLFPYLFALLVGIIAGELSAPALTLGSVIKIPDFSGIFNSLSVFAVGLPSLKMFLNAVPMACIAYILAFGDFVTSESLVNEARAVRSDEIIDFNSNRSNLISGVRNLAMGVFTPFPLLCGPLWVSMTASVSLRYAQGRKAMDSIFGGAATFRIATLISVCLIPIVSFMNPIFPVAVSITLLFQAFVCSYLGMEFCKTNHERMVAGITGALLVFKGPAWGLIAGIFLHFLIGDIKFKNTKKPENPQKQLHDILREDSNKN